MVARHITLSDEQARHVEEVVASGRFRDASDYVNHLLDRDQQRRRGYAQLADMMRQSAESGEPIEATPQVLQHLRDRMLQAAQASRRGG